MKLSAVPVEKGFRVCAMSPLGTYPANSFVAPSAALIVDPEICFSVVRVKGMDWGFSEVDTLHPLEIPLLGCISLAGQDNDIAFYPYPSYRTILLESDSAEELSDDVFAECKSHLLAEVKRDWVSWPTLQIHKPPAIGGLPYKLIPSRHCDPQRLTILWRLETANAVLLRGVANLIKAHIVWSPSEFREAGCIYLWIALDAAFSLTLRKLRETGLTNPTAQDAADYVNKLFGYESSWEKFFERDYSNRISVIHPDSRFGTEVRPSLLADDFEDLNEELIPLFQHIVLNY